MTLKYLKAFYCGSIDVAKSHEETWSPPTDIHIRRIYIIDRDGYTLTKVDFYLKVGEKVITRDKVPASLFGQDPWIALPVDIDVPAKTEIYFKLTNNDSIAHNIVVVLEITE